MTTTINLEFTNNQNWFLPFNMSQFAALYDLTRGVFRMQMRKAPGVVPIVYSWSSSADDQVPGTIVYDPLVKFIYSVALYQDMRLIRPSVYVYDLRYDTGLTLTPGVPLIQDLAEGTVTVSSGVTLS